MAKGFSWVEVLSNRGHEIGYVGEDGWSLRAHVLLNPGMEDTFYTAPDKIEQGAKAPIRGLSSEQTISLDDDGNLFLNGSQVRSLPHRTSKFIIKGRK